MRITKTIAENVAKELTKKLDEKIKEHKKDLEKVNSKLNERKLVERAKGILIREFKISEDEAYTRIRKLSMDKRTTMMEIAKMIIIGYDD